MKICHGGPGYKEDERMHWLSKKRYKIGLVIPTLVVYMVFIIIPIGMSIGYSFTKYSGIGKATFNGLTNYMRLFKVLDILKEHNDYVYIGICIVIVFIFSHCFVTE